MSKFIGLDFLTMKPYLGGRNIVLFGAMAILLAVMNGSANSGIGIGLLIAFLLVGYPFSISEKNNTDALYTTLAVDRKGVVRGRFLFTLVMNICTVAVTYICSTAVLLVFTKFKTGGGDSLVKITAIAGLFILLQVAQLPVYFKIGYCKAKFLNVILGMGVGAVYGMLSVMNSEHTIMKKLTEIFAKLIEQESLFVAAVVGILVIATFVSYNLSMAFYKKREF